MTEPIFRIDDNVQFEWCTFAVYPHPTVLPDRYAVYSAVGCSCNQFEPPDEQQLRADEPLSRAEARRRLVAFTERHTAFINAGQAVTYLERFETALAERA